ncbi:ADP-dependent glucokinase-like [Mercenaria mercenaria]|uniref:ADP-dependent glucokinase-like n=1 Tax=Mercenaria mercenaria TaxID=6596 RepID=UPI001E1DF241|nr:ADP-dependent glucokinase-like [Mercenaria mercenaria]
MAFLNRKSLAVCSLLVLLCAVIYKKRSSDLLQEKLGRVLHGLLRAEKKVGVGRNTRIALGFGGCEDIFANFEEVFAKLNYTSPSDAVHVQDIKSESDFMNIFAYFFGEGAAAERYVENATLFSEIAAAARDVPSARLALGGNAPAMARRLAIEGAEILLAARFTEQTRKQLPESIKVLGKPLDVDELHLILEYSAGSKWGNYSASRANRFIIHSDKSNPFLDTLEDLEMELPSFDPSVLVVGGLQMMDNFPFEDGVREERLKKLNDLLVKTDRTTKTHFEMASFSDPALMKEIVDTVVYHCDSLGMNEQELPNLVSILTRGEIALLSDSRPRIATVLDQMRTVFHLLKDTKESNGRRKLTRLHVHTLAYQAILTKKGSDWKNTMSAAAKASLTANRHVCGSNYIDTEKAKLLMDESFSTSTYENSADRIPLEEQRPVSCWSEDEFDICLAPVLVCTEVLQTGGGGDNISSAGLLYQI